VLKHNTVEHALMIEIDAEEVQILRELIPEWSDCTDFTGGSGSCYDDPRAELRVADATKWFIDNFGQLDSDEDDAAKESVEPFDVM
jgi:spermidine synthase